MQEYFYFPICFDSIVLTGSKGLMLPRCDIGLKSDVTPLSLDIRVGLSCCVLSSFTLDDPSVALLPYAMRSKCQTSQILLTYQLVHGILEAHRTC